MSENSEPKQRDMGLSIHRVLQWAVAISTTVTGTVIVSGMDTWDHLKANAIRMESVPGDVRAIREQGAATAAKVVEHEWRLDAMEKAKPRR